MDGYADLWSMNIALIGATGLTGSELLKQLLADNTVHSVRLLVRKPLPPLPAKVEVHVVDFSDPGAYGTALEGCDVLFVAIGTTMRKVRGDRKAYRAIDHDIPAFAARAAAAKGVRVFGLVSSVGADASLRSNFYLRLKGETEEEVSRHGIHKVLLARPSFLMGDRQENRPAERMAQVVLVPLMDRLLPPRWSRYHSIAAADVARALVSGAKNLPEGRHILEYDALMALSKGI
jgi:uncharacterized protein YbjT (DUF2867 family)